MDIIFMIVCGGLWIILGLILVVGVIYISYATYVYWKKEKLNEYERLYRYVSDEFHIFQFDNKNLNKSKALYKFFSDKTNYKKALNLKQYNDFRTENYNQYPITGFEKEDLKKKRQFSYQYEKLVYDIFSPWGIYVTDDKWLLSRKLNAIEIIDRIGEKLGLMLLDSIKLFDEFIKNGLIQKTSNGFYIMGYTLFYWDCVSKKDWSFSKWMTFKKNHIYRDAELKDFIEEYGSYEIINENNRWYIRFGESRNYLVNINIIQQEIIDLIYSWDGDPSKRIWDFQFESDKSDETKNRIIKMIEDNIQNLGVSDYSLVYWNKNYKNAYEYQQVHRKQL